MATPIVVIVGRPNVGKSTLFNRLIGERKSITDDISGVTRDRIYGSSFWNGKEFMVIDTGGYVDHHQDIFEKAIAEQVEIAIDEADVIIFMVDVTTGITDLDESVSRILRKTKKPVFLAVNKVDNSNRLLMANEFWSLGIEHTFFLSSISGSGTGEILDSLTELLPDPEIKEEKPEIPKFAIVGQPNVGKSSYVNQLMGEERNIVTDIAGTTRDSIHSYFNKFGKEFFLIDTAGIRKKSKVHENLEFYSVMRAVKAIDEADVCFLLLDAEVGLETQDLKIFQLIIKRNKGIVVLVNKWDLIEEKETNTAKTLEEEIKRKLAPFNDLPILFMSVLEKQRIFKALDLGIEVFRRRQTKISTSELNEFLQEILERNPPPSIKGKLVKIKYVTQLPIFYPSFAFFCNHPKYIKESYRNYIENQMRSRYDFKGVPISIYFRDK